ASSGGVDGTSIGSGPSIDVSSQDTYFAVANFNTCSGPVSITDEIAVTDYRKVWTSLAGTTDWYTPGNWTNNAIPTLNDCVIIPDVATTFSRSPSVTTATNPGFARSLRVETNASLELRSEASIVVADDIYVENTTTPNGKLIIRDDANLI